MALSAGSGIAEVHRRAIPGAIGLDGLPMCLRASARKRFRASGSEGFGVAMPIVKPRARTLPCRWLIQADSAALWPGP